MNLRGKKKWKHIKKVLFLLILMTIITLVHYEVTEIYPRHNQAIINRRLMFTVRDSPSRRKAARDVRTLYPQDLVISYRERNRNICENGRRVSVLFMVHTAPLNHVKRSTIRETFTNQFYFTQHLIRVIFLIGRVEDPGLERDLQIEQETFRDIVRGMFLDSYHNLTVKAVMGLKWITENCPNVSLVIKMDDDVFVNTYTILDKIRPTYTRKHIICHVYKEDSNLIARRSRWKIDPDYLKHYNYFPWGHCSGFAVILTGDLVPLMYKASLVSPFLWIDDVYFTGILPSKIKDVKLTRVIHRVNNSLVPKRTTECFVKPDCPFLFGISYKQKYLWTKVVGFHITGKNV